MTTQPYLSLCMPTNGVIEWVFPVLDSIFSQGVDKSLFEVVITDNGTNSSFKERMKTYISTHKNIIYAETSALPFINEIESYKRASGRLIKFVNHRTKLVGGALQKLISFSKKYYKEKPITYFSNGVLKKKHKVFVYKTFDQFVRNLSYFSSWSTGMTIWKDDFDKLPSDVSGFNELFPHTNVLFNERERGKYIIDNSVIFDEIPQGKKPKGDYDLFFAFGIEFPWIISSLCENKSITAKTCRTILNDNLDFIAFLYVSHIVLKRYCSYDLSGLENMYGVFYSKSAMLKRVPRIIASRFFRKAVKRIPINRSHK